MGAQDYLNLLKDTVVRIKTKKKTIHDIHGIEMPSDNATVLMEKIDVSKANVNEYIRKVEDEIAQHIKDLSSKEGPYLATDHIKGERLFSKLQKLKDLRRILITGGVATAAIGVNRLYHRRKSKSMEDSLKESSNQESLNREAILDFLNDKLNLEEFIEVTEGKRVYDKLRTIKKETKHKVKPLVRKTSAQWMLKHKSKE